MVDLTSIFRRFDLSDFHKWDVAMDLSDKPMRPTAMDPSAHQELRW